MTAVILVVDDIPSNTKILEIKLTNKYYQVITACCGKEAIKIAKEKQPDIILMDVMMPEMDGFEASRILKKEYSTMHIPVIIVTALTDTENKIEGLESGADEFLIKPVKDFLLFARVKSLLRFKSVVDELRLRLSTQAKITHVKETEIMQCVEDIKSAKIAIMDDEFEQFLQLKDCLSNVFDHVFRVDDIEKEYEQIDAVIINISISKELLRFCSVFKSKVKHRLTPVIAIIEDEEDKNFISEIMDIGVNDYIALPINENELMARVKTQVKKKNYQNAIEKHVDASLKMSITDPLTLLYNRYYFEQYMNELLITTSKSQSKTLSVVMLDVDNFKLINDTHGHLSGDLILRQIASILKEILRLNDLIARIGGEEIVIVLVDINLEEAKVIAERIRSSIAGYEFMVIEDKTINVTVSMGIAEFKKDLNLDLLLKDADQKLYMAKSNGRNAVVA